jgi:hypothetical protein
VSVIMSGIAGFNFISRASMCTVRSVIIQQFRPSL